MALHISLLLATLTASAAPGDAPRWLQLGPVAAPLPALQADEADVADLVAQPGLDLTKLWPQTDDEVDWPDGTALRWSTVEAGRRGIELERAGDQPMTAWLASYVATGRFVTAALELDTAHPAKVYVDGQMVVETAGLEPKDDPASADLQLPTGKHLVLVHTAVDPESKAPWRLAVTIEVDDEPLEPSPDPTHGLRIADLLDTEAVSGLALSPDGSHLALTLRRPEVPADWAESWTEIRSVADGSVVAALHDGQSGFQWAPDGNGYAFRTNRDEAGTLWLARPDRAPVKLLADVEGLGGYQWAPDGRSIVYGVVKKHEPDETGLKRLEATVDRWGSWRDETRLFQVSVPDGVVRALTANKRGLSLRDVHPGSDRVLVSWTEYDTGARPFSRTDLHELDLASLQTRELASSPWFGAAQYSPDGAVVMVTGGPSMFDGIGNVLGEGLVPNDYDTQAYVIDLDTLQPRPLTLDFRPSIDSAQFDPAGGVVLVAKDGSATRIYVGNAQSGDFEPIESTVDVVGRLAVPRSGAVLAWVGSSANAPYRVVVRDGGKARTLFFPGEERYGHVAFGKVEPWDFERPNGVTVPGRVHYPPDFDPAGSYPVIVNYYAGTSPISRSFGGRYPANFWAANGYIVYILQPSGAVGYGQELSERHVNSWGLNNAGEIIGGTDAFLAAHPYADPERVGCIGASYGGFMTMLLITETDLFAAATAHAGISALSSYWGEGWWGQLYSAVASADSYPWNNPDLYVGQSPLFRADRVDTPLLLLHGVTDINVPVGESDQFYTALKTLNKEVEYVQVQGEGHWILDYPKRDLWMQTIVAWFDKHLKDQPEWWNHLFDEGDAEE